MASAAYVAVVLPIDILLGANYGFVGKSRPLNPSIVDLLGPWPERLLIIVPLAALAMLLALLPWLLAQTPVGRTFASATLMRGNAACVASAAALITRWR